MVLEKTHRLILKNDSENDFMYVMAALIKCCNHERNQAEQCAIITHNNGKCDISSGNFVDMVELQNELINIGLEVEIEEYVKGDLH